MKTKLPIVFLLFINVILVIGCASPRNLSVPADFSMVLVANNANVDGTENISIQIKADGEGKYEIYEDGGTIEYNENGVLVYAKSQVVSEGSFKVSEKQLSQLWEVVQSQDFFHLDGDYRMAIGRAFAYIMIEANGQKHTVDNIGMSVPAARNIIEYMNSILPSGIALVYREDSF